MCVRSRQVWPYRIKFNPLVNLPGAGPWHFFSFNNEKDYVLIFWFHESTCTKENVDQFFEDERLISLHKELNFHNVDQWLKQFDQISHDSKKNRWANQDLKIFSECEDESMTNVNFNYQNFKNDIRFLFDHESFKSHFSYNFVRQYNDDDERIYNEMHIDDWWWKTQKKLSKQTTIISIFIAIEKIMLIQHHDDIFIWFVYMIIETWIETFVDLKFDRIMFYSISFRLWTVRLIKSSYDITSCQSCWNVNTW